MGKYYFAYKIKFYEEDLDSETKKFNLKTDQGIVCGKTLPGAVKKLEQYYGEIEDILSLRCISDSSALPLDNFTYEELRDREFF